jgi:DNA-binding GntR family transcriptional regulator
VDALADWAPEQTQTDRAYLQIEEEIVTLRIPPGTVVSEALLSKRLSVGRTPVREALQRLARKGLVTIMPRRGVAVSEIDVAAQIRLLEVRRELERLLARAAAQRASPAQREQFRRIAEGMDEAEQQHDQIAFMRLDREFNRLLLEASGNEFGTAAMGLMNGLSRRFWFAHYRVSGDLPEIARLHAATARAVASGDRDAAGSASDALVSYIQDFARAEMG